MKIFLFVLISLLLSSCNRISKDSKSTTSDYEKFEFVAIGNFSESKKLFMNLYKGMSQEEFRSALKEHIGKDKLFMVKRDEIKSFESDRKKIYQDIDIDFLTSLDISNAGLFYEKIYYKYNFEVDYCMARMDPVFDDNSSLLKIELTMPVAVNSAEALNYSVDFDVNKEIHEIYRSKYGAPRIHEKKQGNLVKFMTKNSQYSTDEIKEFSRDYIYNSSDKDFVAVVNKGCCSNLTTITYLLSQDYIRELEEKKSKNHDLIREKEKKLKSTKEDI